MNKEIKESVYNIKFSYNFSDYIYNARTTTLALIERPITEYFHQSDMVSDLLANGFAVPLEIDETQFFLQTVEDEINKIPEILELTVVLTENCNFNCTYCYQRKSIKTFSIADVCSMVDDVIKLIDNGLKSILIHYFGGEPLLNLSVLRRLDCMLKSLCEEKNVKFASYITTNGSLLTSDILEEFNFNTIQLTFDGDINTHTRYKISKNFGYSDLLNKVYLVLSQSSSKIRIRFNICEENAEDFFSVIDNIIGLNAFDDNRISFIFNPMRNYYNSIDFTELSPVDFSKIDLRLRTHILNSGKKLFLPKAATQPCKFTVGNAICIGPNSESYFCTSSFYDFSSRNTLKNYLNKNKIKYVIPDICKKCNVLPLCLCPCKLLNPEVNACISEKFIIVDLLKLYLDDPSKWKN